HAHHRPAEVPARAASNLHSQGRTWARARRRKIHAPGFSRLQADARRDEQRGLARAVRNPDRVSRPRLRHTQRTLHERRPDRLHHPGAWTRGTIEKPFPALHRRVPPGGPPPPRRPLQKPPYQAPHPPPPAPPPPAAATTATAIAATATRHHRRGGLHENA